MKLNGNIEITNEDNMILMARYPDNYFDLAVVDPPYGAIDGMNGGGAVKMKKEFGIWDIAPTLDYFTELLRVSKDQIIWGGNYFADKIPISNRWIIFEKYGLDKLPQFELAWTSVDVPNKIWGASRLDLNINFGKRIHPTEKPVKLYQWIFTKYAKKNFKILDTNLGSGNIAKALDKVNKLDKMNLSIVACEIDKEYFEASIKNIKLETDINTINFK